MGGQLAGPSHRPQPWLGTGVAKVLYLVHRIPYPPNKGDKVRSFHLLQHIARTHQVYLGTFVDDPEDWQHVATLSQWCADVHVEAVRPAWARIKSLGALITGDPLTLAYYRSPSMRRWAEDISAGGSIDATIVFSSVMASFAPPAVPMLVDFVDADSAKWAQYADQSRWPMSWVYRREGERLLTYERAVAKRAVRSFLVTSAEVALFEKLAPDCAGLVEPLCNGVDAEYFSPMSGRDNPFRPESVSLVFTGAMDYWPNVDAVEWFCKEVMPTLRDRVPGVILYIVGRSPSPAVNALSRPDVIVTGTVPDVRPYLQYAHLVVAPLRIARGVQNKILEAMAMARPVVTSTSCMRAIVSGGRLDGLAAADDPASYVDQIAALLADPARAARAGVDARDHVVRQYSWQAHLSGLDRHLDVVARGGR